MPREDALYSNGGRQPTKDSSYSILPASLTFLEFFLVSEVLSSIFPHEEEGVRNEGWAGGVDP